MKSAGFFYAPVFVTRREPKNIIRQPGSRCRFVFPFVLIDCEGLKLLGNATANWDGGTGSVWLAEVAVWLSGGTQFASPDAENCT